MAAATSVSEELWNIFTFYTLHGDPLDPEHMKPSQFLRLCKECRIMDGDRVIQATVHMVYTAEAGRLTAPAAATGARARKKRTARGAPGRRMNFNEFLNAIMKLSKVLYPMAPTIDDAFQMVLMEHVLPLASRRTPKIVAGYMEEEEVASLLSYYSDALLQIFGFYSSSGGGSGGSRGSGSGSRGSGGADGGAGSRTGGSKSSRRQNSMKSGMSYANFLKFSHDFNLSTSTILSTIEIGDIYLCATRAKEGADTVRKLRFPEFKECLIRAALVAYDKISTATPRDKIQGLFLYMWRALNKAVPRAMVERSSLTTYAGDLMRGAMLFNNKFTTKWREDEYRDYLSPDDELAEHARDVLGRLMARDADEEAARRRSPRKASPRRARGGGGSSSADSAPEAAKDALSDLFARRPSVAEMLKRSLLEPDEGESKVDG
eukprot:PLAT2620.1.p1 GENE.PLAT2620.1~~PLAT2620.1.p1  ORF type:complete len:440 (+),score=160.43 PLAT2620.1:24-1322(+)